VSPTAGCRAGDCRSPRATHSAALGWNGQDRGLERLSLASVAQSGVAGALDHAAICPAAVLAILRPPDAPAWMQGDIPRKIGIPTQLRSGEAIVTADLMVRAAHAISRYSHKSCIVTTTCCRSKVSFDGTNSGIQPSSTHFTARQDIQSERRSDTVPSKERPQAALVSSPCCQCHDDRAMDPDL
jgi:hypothetical protein